MKIKVFHKLCVVLLLALILSSCARSEMPCEPKKVLSNYLDALIYGKNNEIYRYMSAKSKYKEMVPQYASEKSFEGKLIQRQLAKTVSFEIREIVVKGDRATAYVDVKAPYFEVIFEDLFQSVSLQPFPESNLEALSLVSFLALQYAKKYCEEGLPAKITRETFYLIKETGGWKLFPPRDMKAERFQD